MSERTLPRRGSLLGNVLLALGAGLLFLLCAEGLVRCLEAPCPSSFSAAEVPLAEDGGVGGLYTMRSNATGWPPWERFNRDGVRDRTHPLEKPELGHRVICLGDSVTFGPDDSPENAYPQQLQQRLDELGPYVEVFNLSLWGWCTRRERLAYESIGRAYQPDQVILGICLNDVADLASQFRPPRWLVGLHRRSALVRWAIDAEGRQVRSIEELFAEEPGPEVEAGLERLFGELRALRLAVERDGAELSVLVFPFRPQVTPNAPAPIAQHRIEAFCAAEDLPYLDLLPALAELGEDAFEPEDGIHLSPEGCARTTEEVLEQLIPADVRVPRRLRQSPDPVPGLLAQLSSPDALVRAEAAWGLGRLGPAARSAVADLQEALGDTSERVRMEAARALGALLAGSQTRGEAVLGLLEALHDERQGVRWSAAQALWRIAPAGPQVLRGLQAAYRGDDLYIRAFAVWYVGELRGRAGVPLLVEATREGDAGLRSTAIRALGKAGSGEPAAAEALRACLASLDWDDRWKAARALGKLGDQAGLAIPDLERALRDESDRVREEAARAIERIRSRG